MWQRHQTDLPLHFEKSKQSGRATTNKLAGTATHTRLHVLNPPTSAKESRFHGSTCLNMLPAPKSACSSYSQSVLFRLLSKVSARSSFPRSLQPSDPENCRSFQTCRSLHFNQWTASNRPPTTGSCASMCRMVNGLSARDSGRF